MVMLCVDLDGTLYNSQHKVSSMNAKAIAAASERGWEIVLCTGRGPTMYVPTAMELGVLGRPLHLVGYNGAVVYEMTKDGGIANALFETKMTKLQVEKVLSIADGLAVEYDIGVHQYARAPNAHAGELLKQHVELCASSPIMGLPNSEECQPNKISVITSDPQAFVAKANSIAGFENDGIAVVQGGPFWCETINMASDKESGLKLVAKKLCIDLADCVYFGDGANDATGLKACGLGVAMRDAKPEAIQAANRMSTWTNDEDAVAKEIFKILENTTK